MGEPADELHAARPEVDQLDMAHVRARAEQRLFGRAVAAKVGRYHLLGKTGNGGMGVVHAAYDPDLHRKVALKILHPQYQHAGARERLIVEARALAKLDHPNIVKVHDVLTHDALVVLVMEWVEGETLAVWQSAVPRSWQDILPIYVQAAHGLAAAHSVGVIHRDFKPANAILGIDGRVRVLDFGLARPAHGDDPLAMAARPDIAAGSGQLAEDRPQAPGPHGQRGIDPTWPHGLTATGALVGTLGYAPPEQLEGHTATPASDQFSFAVSLHHALEGVAPFIGNDIAARLAAIRARVRALATDDRVVPAWLRRAIARCLSPAEQERYPSMQAVIDELSRPRGWRRLRGPVALTTLAAVALVAIITRQSNASLPPCDGGRSEIDPVWSATARARVSGAFDALRAPKLGETRDRVVRDLDAYRARWVDGHRDACLAHRRGTQSEALLDRRMTCLRRRLVDLQSGLAAMSHLDLAAASRTVELVSRLPDIGECADVERLQAQSSPPPLAIRNDVARIRDQLSRATALERLGRSVDAVELTTAASADAERLGYPQLIADAALARGRMLLSRGDMPAATTALARSLEVALQHRELATAVEAGARKIFVEGVVNPDLPAVRHAADFLLPLSVGLPGDHFARPLLLNNIGSAHISAGDRARAQSYFQQAHDALAGATAIDPELTCIDLNLARLTHDAASREALARQAWTRRRDALGDTHLDTLDALNTYARLIDEPARSLPLLAQVCNAYEDAHPELIWHRAYCEGYRAFLTERLGDPDEASRLYDDVVALAERDADEDARAQASLARGAAALLRGNPVTAAAAWQPLATANAASPYWWRRVLAAQAELGLATASQRQHRDADALIHFERAAKTYREAAALDEETQYRLRLDLAQRGIASLAAGSAVVRAGAATVDAGDAAAAGAGATGTANR